MQRFFPAALVILALLAIGGNTPVQAGGPACCRGYQGYYWATPATGYFGTPYSFARPVAVFLPPYKAYGLYGVPGQYGNHCCPYGYNRAVLPCRQEANRVRW